MTATPWLKLGSDLWKYGHRTSGWQWSFESRGLRDGALDPVRPIVVWSGWDVGYLEARLMPWALFYIPQAIPKFPFQALWWGGCILPVWEAIDILMPVPWVGVFVCNCAWMGGACIESSAWMSGQRVTYSNFAMQRDDRCYWLLEVLIFWLICVNEQHKLCVMQL